MKIVELRLTAYGPFTNRTLDLGAGNQGLHVIFGPNEAGKSAALRALHALLYGIPAQTKDAFLHPYDGLRIGGRLRLSNGDEIDFIRRKGNKGTLLTPDNTRLDDHALDRFLGGVGPDHFRMFWGIDHAHLVQGGHDILEGHGDLGESLFAAGLGASHLRSLRTKLEEEAAIIFVPRGRSRVINQDLGQFHDLRIAQREATVSAEEWTRQNRALLDAEKQAADATAGITKLSKEKSRLERVKRVLPLLARRSELSRHIADLGDVVHLPEDFAKRRQKAQTDLSLSQQRLVRVVKEVQEQETVVVDLGSTPLLADLSDIVNDLYQRLGSYRKALRDRPGLVARCGDKRALARRLLGELRPDLDIEGAETLRIFVGRRARIQKLTSEHDRLVERLDLARQSHETAKEHIKALAVEASALPAARDSERLVAAIDEARSRGNVEVDRNKAAQAAVRLTAQRDALVERLRLPREGIDRLERLRLPTANSIGRFERKAQEIEDEGRADKTEGERTAKTIRELDAKIEAFRKKGDIPSEQDLIDIRARRDTAFGLLRDHWEKNRDVEAEARELFGKGKLIDLYRNTVGEADKVADRLRSEADRVAELAQYLEKRDLLLREGQEASARSHRRKKASQELEEAWQREWKSVLEVPPLIHDARSWCDEFARLVERSGELATATQQRDELDTWMEKQTKGVRAAVTSLEPSASVTHSLASTLATAEKLRQRIEKESSIRSDHARRVRETQKASQETAKAEHEALEGLQSWQGRWIDSVQGLTQGDAPAPDDALVALEGVGKILEALGEASGYDERVAGIDRETESFRGDIRALAERLHETGVIAAGAEDMWIDGLHDRLVKVLQEEQDRRHAHDRLGKLQIEAAHEREAVETAEMMLAALRNEARCASDSDLVGVERCSSELRTFQTELGQIEKSLVSSGDGASITELEAEAAGVDKDGIEISLTQIATELQVVDKTLLGARDARVAAEIELRRLSGPSAASEKAEEIQATLARLREDALSYARLRLASTLLSRRIDEYRHRNQAPLLLRAAELFRDLTLGKFNRLEADMEDDRPVVVGIKEDGKRVPAYGMSEGTRDQLFLALRLATVEASCDAGEPMPFVVDDILVQFDDDRSGSALSVLTQLSARTQVVLFTHHLHVRRCAEAQVQGGMVVVHEL